MKPEKYFRIFQQGTDNFEWPKLIEYAHKETEIRLNVRKKWVNALLFLRKEFGEKFLQSQKHQHPLFNILTAKSLAEIKVLLNFAATLQELKNSRKSYEKILNKLKSPSKCKKEGLPFIEIAQMLYKRGFAINFQQEKLNQKNADIEVSYPATGDRFFIEVSELEESLVRKMLDENFRNLSHAFQFDGSSLPFSCQQEAFLPNSEMQEVLIKIKQLKEAALQDKAVKVFKTEKISFAVCHPDAIEDFIEWCNNNNQRKGLNGPALDFNETSRICNNKIAKAKQIPQDSSGLIYLTINWIYFLVFNSQQNIDKIQRQMESYENLLGIVIFSKINGGDDNLRPFIDKDHFYLIKNLNSITCRHLLFVFNKNYKGALSAKTLTRLFKSFT